MIGTVLMIVILFLLMMFSVVYSIAWIVEKEPLTLEETQNIEAYCKSHGYSTKFINQGEVTVQGRCTNETGVLIIPEVK
jgi:hypothetical protein